MVVSAVGCPAVTRAPSVTWDLPVRPEMGAVTRVCSRLMRADSMVAFQYFTSASACLKEASASSKLCWLTAPEAKSSR
ncbi:MAG: hypothetical protein BWX71_02489 [Deltaproteobacteria bacterium ADurb.Bin072]|nr:MAG: hypothetical protein BWX71_02489 [Deltaproteobacteria bacterium ADurb.Bin072]